MLPTILQHYSKLISSMRLPESDARISEIVLEALTLDMEPAARVNHIFSVYPNALRDNERYWVTAFEALMVAHYEHGSSIFCVCLAELHSLTTPLRSACTLPVLAGILRAVNFCNRKASDEGLGDRCPAILGNALRSFSLLHDCDTGEDSDVIVALFSSAFNQYVHSSHEDSLWRLEVISSCLRDVGVHPRARKVINEVRRSILFRMTARESFYMFFEYFGDKRRKASSAPVTV